jgi:hypothetical protein
MSGFSGVRRVGMQLSELVDEYLALGGGFGVPVPLAAFNLGQKETERLFSAFDEDYHISRFLHFAQADGATFVINGEPETHVSINTTIRDIL